MDSIFNEINSDKNVNKLKISKTGKLLITITGGAALGLTIICIPFVAPAFRKFCLPYVPATNEQVRNIFTALKNRTGTLIDLGSGDGRIVLEAAKRGFISTGVELNSTLVFYSKINAFLKGQSSRTKFLCKDLWKCDLKSYDNVIIFGVEQMMNDLEKKLLLECHPESNIIACRFPLPNLIADQTIGLGIDTVWLYKTKNNVRFKKINIIYV